MTQIIEYTTSYTADSSLIDEMFYNANNKTLTLDLNDTMYRYAGVEESDVARLLDGDPHGSVGAYYNTTFKNAFGPAERLGSYEFFQPVWVPVVKDTQATPTTPKGLVDISSPDDAIEYTNSYSLSDDQFNLSTWVDLAVEADEPTKEFSLDSEPAQVAGEEVKITVHFTLDNYDKKFKFVAESSDPYEAVDELRRHVKSFGATGRVSKVVIKFV